MSRSRKKVWGWTDHRAQSSKIDKRFANKKVRKIYSIQKVDHLKRYIVPITFVIINSFTFPSGKPLKK